MFLCVTALPAPHYLLWFGLGRLPFIFLPLSDPLLVPLCPPVPIPPCWVRFDLMDGVFLDPSPARHPLTIPEHGPLAPRFCPGRLYLAPFVIQDNVSCCRRVCLFLPFDMLDLSAPFRCPSPCGLGIYFLDPFFYFVSLPRGILFSSLP